MGHFGVDGYSDHDGGDSTDGGSGDRGSSGSSGGSAYQGTTSTTGWIDRLKGLSNIGDQTLGSSFTKLLLLPIAAFFISLADLVEAGFSILVNPLSALGINVGELIDNLVGGSAQLLGTGVQVSGGDLNIFGIAAFPLSFAIVAVVLFMLGWVLSQEDTSNLLPFTRADLPILGAEEDD
jgi:hypothetical protein